MKRRQIREGVDWLGALDWTRRLFEALTPTPHGTTYNAFLVRGSEKTALLDAVDPPFTDLLFAQLHGVERIDYVVSHHAEQDHSGSIPAVLARYPEAVLVCSAKAKPLLVDHLGLAPERIQPVADGEVLSLGDKSLRFISAPWVHWPETMLSYLVEDRILFTGDLFGAHLPRTDLFAGDDPGVLPWVRSYYAEIMMPYRKQIGNHLAKLEGLDIDMIAPVHGPIHDRPAAVLAAYRDWTSERVANVVVLPYVSMHGSTELMANHLIGALAERDIVVRPFELSSTDIAELCSAVVDAATLVVGTSSMLTGPHPSMVSAVYLINLLRPKLRYTGVFGSYGWGTKMVDDINNLMGSLKVETLDPVLCKGLPKAETFAALDAMADGIQQRHAALGAA